MNTICAGIDGCRGGWIMIFHDGRGYNYALGPALAPLLDKLIVPDERDGPRDPLTGAEAAVLIDIPLGLSSPGFPRTIETSLRRRLPGRSSTVFSVPCRSAVYAEDPAEARRLNILETEKSLSEQSLNIRGKIREADLWLCDRHPAPADAVPAGAQDVPAGSPNIRLHEGHPELSFSQLNGGDILMSKKSQPEGRRERLEILAAHDPAHPFLFERIMKETRRKELKADDILDAAALCLIARLGLKRGMDFIMDENREDRFGIEIRIACLKPGIDKIRG